MSLAIGEDRALRRSAKELEQSRVHLGDGAHALARYGAARTIISDVPILELREPRRTLVAIKDTADAALVTIDKQPLPKARPRYHSP